MRQLLGLMNHEAASWVVSAARHLPSWELCNLSMAMGSCFYPMTHRNVGHWVMWYCAFSNTPFLHWFLHWSWDNDIWQGWDNPLLIMTDSNELLCVWSHGPLYTQPTSIHLHPNLVIYYDMQGAVGLLFYSAPKTALRHGFVDHDSKDYLLPLKVEIWLIS